MKALRITIRHATDCGAASRDAERWIEPPAEVTIGRAPECTVVIAESSGPASHLLFDYVGAQFRLLPGVLEGALSFTGYAGPYLDLAAWRTHDGHAPPIALRNHACGELRIGVSRLRFVHAPMRAALAADGPVRPLAEDEARDGVWLCRKCRERNRVTSRFCFGCGGDVLVCRNSNPEGEPQ